jgi:diguanylate cyclase (GGDEF)-like protein/PAS domain S-box-containing protein
LSNDKTSNRTCLKLPEGAKFSKVHLETVFDYLGCPVVLLDRAGRVAYCNSYCKKISGLSTKKLKGLYFWDIFCAEDEKELFMAFFSTLALKDYPLTVHAQHRNSCGQTRSVTWNYNALIEEESLTYHILTGIDNSAHEKAYRELQEVGEKYRTIIHVSPVAVITLDTALRVTSWSSAAENLFGMTEKSTLNKKIFDLIGDRHDILQSCCKKALKGETTNNLELFSKSSDEQEICLNLFMSSMRDFKGSVNGIVMVALDVTDRKNAEKELLDSEKKLRYLSFHDSLTGLFNRTYYEKQVERIEQEGQYPVAVIIADINDLKLVNDTLGHGKGDYYLKNCAALLKNNLRSGDLLARVGGDEFVLLMPKTDRKSAKKLAEIIHLEVEGYNRTKPELPLGLSVGLAVRESNTQSMRSTLTEADTMMYKNKKIQSRDSRLELMKALYRAFCGRADCPAEELNHFKELCFKWSREVGLDENIISDLFEEAAVGGNKNH